MTEITEYENRTAYRCFRCHEWAFVTEVDIRVAQIMGTDALDCPYCDTAKGLRQVGRVERQEVISESQRTACDEQCTSARGTLCVCRCGGKNHGLHLVVTVRRVEGRLEVILNEIDRAKARKPRLLAEIAEYDETVAKVKAILATIDQYRTASGYLPNVMWRAQYDARKALKKVEDMHSHKGRMKHLTAALTGLQTAAAQPVLVAPVKAEPERTDALNGDGAYKSVGATVPNPYVAPAVTVFVPATERQVAYAESLRKARGTAEDAAVDLRDLSRDDASRYIDALLRLPVIPVVASARVISAPAPLPDVREGRYALDEGGTLVFYRIDKPADGRWKGYTFVNKVVGGHDDRDHRTAIRDMNERMRVLTAIKADEEGALKRYGQHIGQCGHCGRVLTDEDSRKAGIGPVCAKAWA